MNGPVDETNHGEPEIRGGDSPQDYVGSGVPDETWEEGGQLGGPERIPGGGYGDAFGDSVQADCDDDDEDQDEDDHDDDEDGDGDTGEGRDEDDDWELG